MGFVQQYEDITNDAVMVLESNANVLKSIRSFYTQLVQDDEFPQSYQVECQKFVRRFSSQIDELIYEMTTEAARAKVLVKIAADRKTIVS